jgi:ArsR family transcriptional regulator
MPRIAPALSSSSLVAIYQCLCDETRLRILHLLLRGPLCVCHIQEIIDRPQVFISKHLAYLRGKELVRAERFRNWMVYALPESPAPELEANLKCLQDCTQTHPVFKGDLRRLASLNLKNDWLGGAISPPASKGSRQKGKKTAAGRCCA